MVKRIYDKVKSVLFADPKLLFEEERQLVKEPFYFEGRNGKAIVLIHGWTSTPYEVRRLGKFLNENGYSVYAPRLKGHGTVPKDLENVRWTDWLKDAEEAFLKLQADHEKIYVGGTSIGANLALMLAQKNAQVSGLILMAMPYGLKFEKIVIAFAKILRRLKKYNKKFYPPTFGLSTTVTRLIAYQAYPIASALETFDLIKASRDRIAGVSQPCFALQSTSDHIVAWNNLEKIYARINSTVKKKKYINKAYHTFISDIKNEHVFEEILSFLNEN